MVDSASTTTLFSTLSRSRSLSLSHDMPVAECLLDPMRLRGVLALVGFGTVLLWVALADYTTSDGGNRGSVDAGLGVESRIRDSAGHHVNSRHLLEIGSLRDSNDSDDSANTPSYDPSSVDVSATTTRSVCRSRSTCIYILCRLYFRGKLLLVGKKCLFCVCVAPL